MTEIPEHLLARSKQRRAALGGDAGEAAAPATTSGTADGGGSSPEPTAATSPAAAPAPVAAAPEPTPPWVEAAEHRRKVPVWAVPALVIIPFFFIVYALTLDEPTNDEGPLAVGTAAYSGAGGCAGCHGGGGGGGVGPQLSGGNVMQTFPEPVDQVTWVALGSTGYQDLGLDTYGATDKPIKGGMPAQLGSLTAEEIMAVVLHERVDLSGETFDYQAWSDGFEEAVNEKLPDNAEEFMAVLQAWETVPPTG